MPGFSEIKIKKAILIDQTMIDQIKQHFQDQGWMVGYTVTYADGQRDSNLGSMDFENKLRICASRPTHLKIRFRKPSGKVTASFTNTSTEAAYFLETSFKGGSAVQAQALHDEVKNFLEGFHKPFYMQWVILHPRLFVGVTSLVAVLFLEYFISKVAEVPTAVWTLLAMLLGIVSSNLHKRLFFKCALRLGGKGCRHVSSMMKLRTGVYLVLPGIVLAIFCIPGLFS